MGSAAAVPAAIPLPLLLDKSKWLRQELFEMVMRSKRGHIPSCYSSAELVCALFYGGRLRLTPRAPKSRDRDVVLVSKGHAAMVLYPVLADLGFFPREELQRFCRPDGLLRMYADHSIPGIEAICGSLGHGFTIATGFALAHKRDGRDFKAYVIVSDGECYEGSVWETAMFAAHYGLDNLITIVDRNGLCILDETERCVKLNPLDEKWRSFGWEVVTVNGHSYREIFEGLDRLAAAPPGKPRVMIANTVKGKGISFMEGSPHWHNKMPNDEQAAQARRELQINGITG